MKTHTKLTSKMKKLLLFIGLLVASNIAFSQNAATGSGIKSIVDKPIVKNDRTTLRHAQPSGDKDFNMHIKKHIRHYSKDEKHDLKYREHRIHRDRVPHNIPGR
jgi:hypothetical protein